MAATGSGLLLADPHGEVLWCNPMAERMLGLVGADLVGRSLAQILGDVIGRGEKQPVRTGDCTLSTISSGGLLRDVVTTATAAGEEPRRIELNSWSVSGSAANADSMLLSMRDVTESHAAEDAGLLRDAVLNAVAQAVVVTDPGGRIVLWNPAAEMMYGWSAAEALGRPVVDIVSQHESIAQGREIVDALSAGASWTGDFPVRRRDETHFLAMVTAAPVFDGGGDLVAMIGVTTDVTERRHTEELALALAAIVDSTGDAILTKALDGTILTWNRGAEILYGYSPEEAIGQHIGLLDPHDGAEVRSILATAAAGDTIRSLETVRRRRDGTHVEVSVTASPIFGADGAVTSVSAIGHDITNRRRLEDELSWQALHDPLTGLSNRTLMNDRLTQALARSGGSGGRVALLLVDLDQFRQVNEENGHSVGDLLLGAVGERLLAVVRAQDTVARFADDAFVILCVDADEADAKRVAGRVGAALSKPIVVADRAIQTSASIGITFAQPPGISPDTLLRQAYAAMHEAKAGGRGRTQVFDDLLDRKSHQRVELTSDLRQAISGDCLEVHYQPVVELATGRFVGVEALARWQHPIHGWISPEVFVGLAEDAGMVPTLDRWILARACRDAASLRRSGVLPLDAKIAVNLSGRSIDATLPQAVREAATHSGLPIDVLELEVTETSLLTDAADARMHLQALRESGASIALDDFGTGYSSLTYLRLLPATTIKIDRSFITHISEHQDDRAITASIVDMARTLGKLTIAEGVETVEQLRLLHQMGCQAGQGYLWSRALPASELATFLKSQPQGFLAATDRASSDRVDSRVPAVTASRQGPPLSASANTAVAVVADAEALARGA